MKNIYLKTLLASSMLLAVGCSSTAGTQSNYTNDLGVSAQAVLIPIKITASSHDGNGPNRLFDQDITTRWSANGDGEWAMYDYGSIHEFNAIRASFSKGNQRKTKFDLLVSTDGKTWTPVLENQETSGRVIGLERFEFTPVKARYIKFVGHGNSSNDWNSVTELAVVNCNINSCPANQIITADVIAAEQDMIAEMKAKEKAAKEARKNLRKGDFGAPAIYPCKTTVTCNTKTALPTPTLPVEPKAGNKPSDNFDLTTWYLSQPFDHDKNGRPDDVAEWDLANGYEHPEFFYTAADGGLVFKSFIKGTRTSKNTKYARTEMREMLRKGNTSIPTKGVNKNNWVFSSAPIADQKAAGGIDGIMEATLKIDHTTTTGEAGQVGRFIIGQIHDQDDEPIRLYYRKLPNLEKGTVYFAHENTLQGTDTFYDLVGGMTGEIGDEGIALGEKFSYRIQVKGNTLTVTVKRDGKPDAKQVVDMSKSGYDVGGKYMYFKAGVYNQNITGDLDDYVQATFYKLEKSHSTYSGK